MARTRKILLVVVIALVIAFILSIVVTFILQYAESTQVESLILNTTITISNETTFSAPFEAFVKKGYFDSVATVNVHLFSPYANCWNTFNAWMSLDNSSWVNVPFLESTTKNYSQMANLGLINLGDPKLTIHQKYYVPPQTILLPPNVTKQDLSDLKANVVIKRQIIPSDTTNWILVFFAVFGGVSSVIGVILGLHFSGKDSNSNTQNAEKRGKKKPRVKAGKKRKKHRKKRASSPS
jgi:hypothetical protein